MLKFPSSYQSVPGFFIFVIKSVILLLMLSSAAAAEKIDLNAAIKIQSDSAYIVQTTQQAIYEGKVILTQGEQTLHADKLIIKKHTTGDLRVITAIGKPATFIGKLPSNPHLLHAHANTIYYYPDKQLIVLKGEAAILHQQNKFEGPLLKYQIDTQTISANKQDNARPTVIIHPRT